MERKLPKNIRQIGNVSDNPKVYVEDYVDTFINQMCEKATDTPVGAFLIGESWSQDGQDYMFIHGSVLMQEISIKNNEVVIGSQTWKKACEEGKKYFRGNTILGWILIAPDLPLKLNHNLEKLHEQLFMRKNRLFVMKNAADKEESFFVYKYNDLMEIGGHYIYYEKNPCMQDYMIASRKQNCVTPSETVEDRATKDFRSVIQKQEQQKKSSQSHKFSYAMSTFLLLMVTTIGVVAMNEYDEIQVLQQTVGQIVNKWRGNENAEQEAETVIKNPIEIEVVNGETKPMLEDSLELDKIADNETLDLEVKEEDLEEEIISEEENTDTSESGESGQGDEAVPDVPLSNVYVVKKGDTLAQISKDEYGSVTRVDDICELNGLKDSNYIYVGQEILLPY